MEDKTAAEVMNEAKQIFRLYHMDFWLDSGTLLGIYRDGKLLPNDHDIDLFMWHPGKDIIMKMKDTFWNNGFVAYYDKQERGYCFSAIKKGCEMTFGLLKPENDYAYLHFFVPKGLKGRIANKFMKTLGVQTNLFTEPVTFKIPLHYFESLKEIDFMGKKFLIPYETEKYLKFRYGKGWLVPDKDYIWYRDDGALLKK